MKARAREWRSVDSGERSFAHQARPAVIQAARARYIFFYGWDSFVVFQGGRLIEREMLPPLTNPWRREVKSARFDASDARETTPLRSGQS